MDEEPYRLRYSFDPGSGRCLWSGNDRARKAFGYSVDPAELPLPPATIAETLRVTDWYDGSLSWAYPPDPSPWDRAEWDRFYAASRALLARLRRDLGDQFDIQDEFHERREW